MLRTFLVLAASAIALAFGATSVSATAPVVTEQNFFGQHVDTRLCGFPIEFTIEGHFTTVRFFDQEGNLVRFELISKDVATATNPANGRSVSGHEASTVHTDFLQGTESTTGLLVHFNVPGPRGALLDAGRVFFPSLEGDELRLSGNFEFREGDLGAFCTALS